MYEAEYYTASWCQPCKTFKPLAMKVFTEAGIPLKFNDVDDDEGGSKSVLNHVASIPTVIVYRKDEGGWYEVDRITGAFPEQNLRTRLDKLG